ncbi:asparaginase [Natronorubrum halophilum]|uniref:asparaginase n=1 Tax=Natronorubrum halophilum TaxID=1702106 RepID=UPI0010C1F6ED|nr:asparaginase [Natronorubrum halophilum]
MPASIVVLSTGGTIASTDADAGAMPNKRGEELLAAVPDVGTHADLTVEEVAQIPSFDMDFETMATLTDAAETALEAGADGVVVTHGTDTMEESAYFVDSTCDADGPIVFTGAQRRPDEVSSDGPSNLLAAVRAASHDRIAEGVYIAANEELHAARDVTKTHTSALETFESPNTGPVASLTRSSIRVFREPRSYCRTLEARSVSSDVPIVTSAAGVGRRAIARALEDDVGGIVVNATGLGNATSAIGDAVASAIDAGTPVVVTSRCHAGTTAAVYGGGGGGETLRSHGAIHGGDLPAHKARIKLGLACESGYSLEEIEALFADEYAER